MVPEDQMFVSFQLRQDLFPTFCFAPTKIADDVDVVCLGDSPVPVFDHLLVHFFDGFEGSLVISYDVGMVKVGIGYIVIHGFLLSKEKAPTLPAGARRFPLTVKLCGKFRSSTGPAGNSRRQR